MKSSRPNLDEFEFNQKQLSKDFKECFNSPAGKQVIEHLRESFYDCAIKPSPGDTLQFEVGQRSVVWYILEQLTNEQA